MKTARRTLIALALAALVTLGFTGVASAQELDYTPQVSPLVEVAGVTQEAAAVSASGTLPYTGSDSLPLAQIGIGLVAAGGLMVVVVKRRNAAES